ncbi:hypothetical protein COU38_01805 [Candidatus Micrarchaeota archaeon CG10_big_fil_rev_8_21_14_0_10_54_18]|nr:MAG: hypothetical protein COU38_01805 [Candidatus Micrarchaeota archaeon CG10_big_fil_rev_8_21_14_0_10_54_18]
MDKSLYVVLGAFLLMVLGVWFFASGGGVASPTPSPSIQAQENVVQILDGSFSPDFIGIGVGDGVTWVNSGLQPHVLYFIDVESPVILPGQEFTRSFENAGNYTYLGEPWSASFKAIVSVVAD